MSSRHSKCRQCGVEISTDTPHSLCADCICKNESTSTIGNKSASDDQTATVTDSITPGPFSAPRPVSTKVHYFGDYELLKELARGGMGVVYKARQLSLNRIVAVKMILGGQLASDAEIRRFRLEAEAAANLQHPNIVAIHEVGEHEGEHYFSMDYVDGVNLTEHVAGKPMPAFEAAKLVQILAEAVHFAHQRGTLHRDLKPQNILIDSAGRPRITDFGLAKLTERESDLTRSGAAMGSPSYMPPEQAGGRVEQVGPASDVYSLGAILYELLTGRAPFRSDTPLGTMHQVINEEPVSPSQHCPQVPLDLETICLKCLSKKPEHRYHSARALAEELDRFIQHQPILARPPGRIRRIWNWSQRNPWALTGVITVAFLTLCCCTWWLWQANHFKEWQHNHPGEPVTMGTQPVLITSILVFFMLFTALHLVGVEFRKQFQRWKREAVPFQTRLLAVYGITGVITIIYSLLMLFKIIELWVWMYNQNTLSLLAFMGVLVTITVLIWRGAYITWQAVALHESSIFAQRVEQVIERQLDSALSSKRRRASSSKPTLLRQVLFWIFAAASAYIFVLSIIMPMTLIAEKQLWGISINCLMGVCCASLWVSTMARVNPWKPGLRKWAARLMLLSIAIAVLWQWQNQSQKLFTSVFGSLLCGGIAAGLLSLALFIRGDFTAAKPQSGLGDIAQKNAEINAFPVTFLAPSRWLWLWILALGIISYYTWKTWHYKVLVEKGLHEIIPQNAEGSNRVNLTGHPPAELNFAKTPLLEAVGYMHRVNNTVWQRFEILKYLPAFGDLKAGKTNDLQLCIENWDRRMNFGNRSTNNPAQHMLIILQPLDADMQELYKASRRPYSALDPPDWQADIGEDSNMPNYRSMNTLAMLFALHASSELALKNPEAAFADFKVIWQLATAMKTNPSILATAVSSQMIMRAVHVFWEGQINHLWLPHHWDAFSQAFASVNHLRDLDTCIRRGEIRFMNFYFEQYSLAAQCLLQAWYFRGEYTYQQLFQEFMKSTYEISPMRVNRDNMLLFTFKAQSNMKGISWLFGGDFPNVFNLLYTMSQSQTFLHFALIASALEQYYQLHGEYPNNLNELSPSFLMSIPYDLCNNQPLHYQRLEERKFLIYSVGWDAYDDGAKVTATGLKENGDWIWFNKEGTSN